MIQINTPRLHLVLHLLVSAFGRVRGLQPRLASQGLCLSTSEA